MKLAFSLAGLFIYPIRWFVYVPFGLLLSIAIIGVTSWSLGEMLSANGAWFFFFVFTGLIVISPVTGLMLLYFSFWLTAAVCPNPKIGMVVFAIIFTVLIPAYSVISYVAGTYSPSWHQTLILAVSCMVALKAFYDIRNTESLK